MVKFQANMKSSKGEQKKRMEVLERVKNYQGRFIDKIH